MNQVDKPDDDAYVNRGLLRGADAPPEDDEAEASSSSSSSDTEDHDNDELCVSGSDDSLQSSVSSNGSNAFEVDGPADEGTTDATDEIRAVRYALWVQGDSRRRAERTTRRSLASDEEKRTHSRKLLAKRHALASAGSLVPHPDSVDPATQRAYTHKHHGGAASVAAERHPQLGVEPPAANACVFSARAAEVCGSLDGDLGNPSDFIRRFAATLEMESKAAPGKGVSATCAAALAREIPGAGAVHTRAANALLAPLTQGSL